MRKPLRHAYTTELKLDAVRRLKRGERVVDIARKMRIPESTLRGWKKGFINIIRTWEEFELQRLRNENRRLRQQLAMARKSFANFTRSLNI